MDEPRELLCTRLSIYGPSARYYILNSRQVRCHVSKFALRDTIGAVICSGRGTVVEEDTTNICDDGRDAAFRTVLSKTEVLRDAVDAEDMACIAASATWGRVND